MLPSPPVPPQSSGVTSPDVGDENLQSPPSEPEGEQRGHAVQTERPSRPVSRRSRHASRTTHAVLFLSSRIPSHVSPRFVCATLDWWPSTKCDYGRCPWAGTSLLEADLTDTLLIRAAKLLAPFYLRLGGSLSDSVTYEEAGGCVPTAPAPLIADEMDEAADEAGRDAQGSECSRGQPNEIQNGPHGQCGSSTFARDDRLRVGFRGGCLSRKRWAELSAFCVHVGCELILSINAMRGRTRRACAGVQCRTVHPSPSCCTSYMGRWNGSNAASLLEHAAERGDPLAAVAFGNELGGRWGIGARLDAAEYAEGVNELHAIIRRAWRGRVLRPPFIIGPNAKMDIGYTREVLARTPHISAISHHLYQLGAGSAQPRELIGRIMRPGFLEKLSIIAEKVQRGLVSAPAKLWVSEMGGAYNSGAPGVTDSFASTFWYADALGTLALHGTRVVCRQTLLGGSYALLALGHQQSGMPLSQWQGTHQAGIASDALPRGVAPDLWVAALWRRLMSGPIFGVSEVDAATGTPLPPGSSPLRVYASCTAQAPGAVAMLAINMQRERARLQLQALFPPFSRAVADEDGSSSPCLGAPLAKPVTLRSSSSSSSSNSSSNVDTAAELAANTAAAAAALWEECARRCLASMACDAFRILQREAAGGINGEGVGSGTEAAFVELSCALYAGTGGYVARRHLQGSVHRAAGSGALPHAGCFARNAHSPRNHSSASGSRSDMSTRHEWKMTARALTSREVLLNGARLRYEAGAQGELPALPPLVVKDGGDTMLVAGFSVNFFFFPDAFWPECDTDIEQTH